MTATNRDLFDGDAPGARGSGRSGDRPQAGPFVAADVVVRHIERTCRAAVDGRRAARVLAEWAQRFELGEAEFQLLWYLRSSQHSGLDQTTLARDLAFSPAQVSATVERVRARGWICQRIAAGDRRRHLWQLSVTGQTFLDAMVNVAALLREEPERAHQGGPGDRANRKAAA